MISAILGTAAFGLFVLSDINDFRWKQPLLRLLFPTGLLLLGGISVWDLYAAFRIGAIRSADWLLLVCAAGSFAALIYCLFFAVPFGESYTGQPSQARTVCDRGVYGLCRHPGVLCFGAMYLFAGLATLPTPLLWKGLWFSLLNLLYVWFQDRITFPRIFTDYPAYRKRVPFLIPNKQSIHTVRKRISRTHTKEDPS